MLSISLEPKITEIRRCGGGEEKSGKLLPELPGRKEGRQTVSREEMFGEQQMSVLADMIQAALMLRYNGRRVG